MSRLALSDADKKARDWFVETTSSLGCDIKIDAMGNIFAVRPGRRDGLATFAGSHLDTQPSGGRYDGILGILAGIEMLKVLKDHDAETEFPVGVVNWTKYGCPAGLTTPQLTALLFITAKREHASRSAWCPPAYGQRTSPSKQHTTSVKLAAAQQR